MKHGCFHLFQFLTIELSLNFSKISVFSYIFILYRGALVTFSLKNLKQTHRHVKTRVRAHNITWRSFCIAGTSLSKSSCQRTCPPLNGTCKYKLFRGYQCVPRTRSSGTIPNIESLRFCQQNCDFPRLCRRSLRGYVCQ